MRTTESKVMNLFKATNDMNDSDFYAVTLGRINGVPGVITEVASGDSYEDAACNLWRGLCDECEMFDTCDIVFVHGDENFVSEELYGCMHYVFDSGRVSFEDALWTEYAAYARKQYAGVYETIKYDTDWDLADAVDEMIALWQCMDEPVYPWEVIMSDQSDELLAVLNAPCFL